MDLTMIGSFRPVVIERKNIRLETYRTTIDFRVRSTGFGGLSIVINDVEAQELGSHTRQTLPSGGSIIKTSQSN